MSEPARIRLSEPFLAGNERRYLEECLSTNFVSSVGPFVERFEQEFAQYVGTRYAVACASGTAAIHVAMRLLGVGPGDDVLVPTLTFVASANPVRYEGGTVVLIDAELESWNIDPEIVVEEIEGRASRGAAMPRVVEVVHVLGQPARIDPILRVCKKYGIAIVEDAAEALGARWTSGEAAGRHVGTVGTVGCFSFNGNKIITSGGGGMIATDDATLAARAKHLTTQARLPGLEYRHDEIGYNYRLTNLAAALGLAQLEQLPGFLARKREIADRYDEALRDIPGLTPPPRPSNATPSFWLYSMLVDPGAFGCGWQKLAERLSRSGIESRPIWSPLHTLPIYRDAPRRGGAVAERLAAHGLSLPCSVGLTSTAQDRVIAALRS